tara:strand:- start:869 stop:1006 length:138 start_codon:yes stop_codon:yes gene_type:complete
LSSSVEQNKAPDLDRYPNSKRTAQAMTYQEMHERWMPMIKELKRN